MQLPLRQVCTYQKTVKLYAKALQGFQVEAELFNQLMTQAVLRINEAESAITRLTGAQTNIEWYAFLEVQDGVLEAAGKIVNRMIELKGLSQDVLKNSSDIDNYNREFQDLQVQLKDMTAVKFNGVSLFAQYSDSSSGSVEGVFDNISRDNTLSKFVSAEG